MIYFVFVMLVQGILFAGEYVEFTAPQNAAPIAGVVIAVINLLFLYGVLRRLTKRNR